MIGLGEINPISRTGTKSDKIWFKLDKFDSKWTDFEQKWAQKCQKGRLDGQIRQTGPYSQQPLHQKSHNKVIEVFGLTTMTLTGKWSHRVSSKEDPEKGLHLISPWQNVIGLRASSSNWGYPSNNNERETGYCPEFYAMALLPRESGIIPSTLSSFQEAVTYNTAQGWVW